MKSVLCVAYYYPPLGGVGSLRVSKITRHLPHNGWQPIILTPEQGSYYIDNTLTDEGVNRVQVVRTATINLSGILKRAARQQTNGSSSARAGYPVSSHSCVKDHVREILRRFTHTWIYIPDGQVGWLPYALRSGHKVMQTQNVDVIFSTSFPITGHLIAYKLKRASGKPWVAEFRDLWTENHNQDPYSSLLRKRLDRSIEARLLEHTDAIVTVSDSLAETLRRLTRGRKRVEVIRNGFDSSDFTSIKRVKQTLWTVVFVGTFYNFYNPIPFLSALHRLIATGRIRRSEVQFKIVGEAHPELQVILKQLELDDIAYFTGFVAHHEALAHQINASLLLFLSHRDESKTGIITGKIFEYIGARQPILAIGPLQCEAAQIIREAGAGTTVEASDTAGIERCLMDSYSAFQNGVDAQLPERDLSHYECSQRAKQLSQLFNELVTNAPNRNDN